MKKMERIIIYGIAIVAVIYGLTKRYEWQQEINSNEVRMAFYYPLRDEGSDFYVTLFEYDKLAVELASNSLSEESRMRLGRLLFFWTTYCDRWCYWKNILLSNTKIEKLEAESEEIKAILKFCEK